MDEAMGLRKNNPEEYTKKSYETMGDHVKAMLNFKKEVHMFLIMEIT